MKLTTDFNEDGVMANGKQFRKQARELNEKELNLKERKDIALGRKPHKGRGDNDKLNKPVRGRRELELDEDAEVPE